MKILASIALAVAIVFGIVLFVQHQAGRSAQIQQQQDACSTPPPPGDMYPITSCPPGTAADTGNPGTSQVSTPATPCLTQAQANALAAAGKSVDEETC